MTADPPAPAVLRAVQSYLSQNLPNLDAQALRDAGGTAGLVAFVVLPVAGLFWVDALRSLDPRDLAATAVPGQLLPPPTHRPRPAGRPGATAGRFAGHGGGH